MNSFCSVTAQIEKVSTNNLLKRITLFHTALSALTALNLFSH